MSICASFVDEKKHMIVFVCRTAHCNEQCMDLRFVGELLSV